MAIRHGLAQALAVPAGKIEMISPFAGGGFGQKNALQMQTMLLVMLLVIATNYHGNTADKHFERKS